MSDTTKDSYRVLLTGANAPGFPSIASHLKTLGHTVIASDYKISIVAEKLSDVFVTTPSVTVDSNQIEMMEYTQKIEEIATSYKIDLIMPIRTGDVMALVAGRYQGKAKLLVPTMNLRDLTSLNNKLALSELLNEHIGMDGYSPHSFSFDDIEELECMLEYVKKMEGYFGKVVVKPQVQSGSRGMRILYLEENMDYEGAIIMDNKPSDCVEMTLEHYKQIFRDIDMSGMMGQEYLVGAEYTVDCFAENGKLIACVPRHRLVMEGGISKVAEVSMDEFLYDMIFEICAAITEELGLSYNFGFQFKLDHKNIPRLIECNPRLQGSTILTVKAGIDVIDMSIRTAMGDHFSEYYYEDIEWGTKMERTFQEWFK